MELKIWDGATTSWKVIALEDDTVLVETEDTAISVSDGSDGTIRLYSRGGSLCLRPMSRDEVRILPT